MSEGSHFTPPVLKGLRMVTRALWRSEAHRLDLHYARATILNPFYNMEYKIIKKMRQYKAWIEADIPCINFTSNRYEALNPASVYVSYGVTIPVNSMKSK